MAKYGSNSTVIEVDGTPGGSLVDLSAYIQTINGFDVESAMEESHGFGKSWRESLATGHKFVAPIVLGGMYDDTATTGPHAILGTTASGPSQATSTFRVTYGGGKSSAVEVLITKYRRMPQRNQITKFESTLTPTGAVTEA